ncbi:hypothetical protein [Sphingobium sp.]|uniref:hypothetical protein n=1 Tax=Sphingobium sp. TaxID=1912891 RepID=UPI000DB833BF|nr:hypothetical protein [Sphingobium sp.]PZU66721.1 MAG: hypothetical protein DI540_13560 [Sphingobium sp.]
MSKESPEQAQPKPFDLLASLAAFAQREEIALNDPTLIDRFMTDARPRLETALSDATLIHGSRTERLFEATVLTLGRYRMLKTEDIGRVHSPAKARAPDFRVVLDDAEQWLVEVKNVRSSKPFKQCSTMSAAYLRSLQTYADMVCAPLKLAIFWSLWNIWTIVSPERFRRPDGGLRVTMQDAVMANEFGRLGEVIIMTRPPLRLVLDADRKMPRKLSPEGMAEFMIDAARMYSGDTELTDPRDRRLAQILFLFGDWTVADPIARMDGGEIGGVEFVAQPEEPSDQGFDGIGWASRIFSRYYAAQTVDGDQVIQLHGEAVPEWFAPLGNWDFKNSRLPLWLGHVEPNGERSKAEPDPD